MSTGCGGIDPGGIPPHHLRVGDAKPHDRAVAPGDHDLVARLDAAQKCEMGVAVGGIDRRAGRAGIRRAFQVARPEGERLAAAAGKDDGRGGEPRDLDARHRPCIGP